MKKLKPIHLVLLIIAIILVDQAIKIWIKTSYPVGEVVRVGGMDWFRIHFIENPGMAWGWKFGNDTGKLILTLFRLAAVIAGTWYLNKMTKQPYSRGLMICAGLIYAGALGNLIDSMFYGMIFNKGLHFDASINDYLSYSGVAEFGGGYSSFLHGSVVDMFYFPMIQTTWPDWVPLVGGQDFEFFSPIFNLADASISVGVLVLFFFQKKLLHPVVENTAAAPTISTSKGHDDTKEIY